MISFSPYPRLLFYKSKKMDESVGSLSVKGEIVKILREDLLGICC